MTKTGRRRGDTFSATIPIDASLPASFWASQDGLDAAAILSAGGETKSLVSGAVDEISIDWINFSVSVSGRDKSADLTQTRRNKKYANKTAADIVKDIAQAHGLDAMVPSGGNDVSKKFDIDTTHLILNRTDFETISQLAEREGVRWFVDGNTLYFGAAASGGVYEVHYRPPQGGYMASNAMSLTTSRNVLAAKTIEATVKSWHHKDKKLYEHTAKATGKGGSLAYEFHHPGMNQQQIEKIAKSAVNEAIHHEMTIEVEMPGDLAIDPTMKLQLAGTGTEFDQAYDIHEITWEYQSGENGFFSMSITGKSPSQGREAE
ncbi:MAG: phage late control D family protein [Methylocella sp.]